MPCFVSDSPIYFQVNVQRISNYVHASKTVLPSTKHVRLLRNWLLAETKGLVTTVESNKLCLEHGVAVDLQTCTLVTLYTTEASGVCCIDSGESDLATGDLGHVRVTDCNTHVGKSGTARVDETTDLSVELSTLDLRVVCLGDLLVDEEERCTCVGNGVGSLRVLEKLIADSKFGRAKLPEASIGLDRNPCHVAFKLGGINLAELIHAGAIWVEIGSEDGHV